MKERITIVGDGQMGLVMAAAAVEAGAESVTVWGPFEESVASLEATRRSSRLPDWRIPDAVEFASDPGCLAGSSLVMNAIPTQFVRPVWNRLAPTLAGLSASKGVPGSEASPKRCNSDDQGGLWSSIEATNSRAHVRSAAADALEHAAPVPGAAAAAARHV